MAQTKPTVLVTLREDLRADFFTEETEQRLESLANVEWHSGDEDLEPAELADRLPGVDIVVTGWGTATFTEAVLEDADDLELVVHTGGSVAGLSTEALYERGVTVCSANRPMARYVAELTLGHVIASQRDIVRSHESIREGRFERFRPYRTLLDRTVGLVGLGTIGRYLVPMLEPFDVTIRVYDPYVPPVDLTEYGFVEKASLEQALSSDVVSIHAARTPETIGMIGAEELGLIPDDALFVNTARAEIVDEAALVEELSSGRIRGVLDVYHEEPLPDDSQLRELENVQLTPHLGGHGPHERFAATMVDEVARYVDGTTLQHDIPAEQADLMTR